MGKNGMILQVARDNGKHTMVTMLTGSFYHIKRGYASELLIQIHIYSVFGVPHGFETLALLD